MRYSISLQRVTTASQDREFDIISVKLIWTLHSLRINCFTVNDFLRLWTVVCHRLQLGSGRSTLTDNQDFTYIFTRFWNESKYYCH